MSARRRSLRSPTPGPSRWGKVRGFFEFGRDPLAFLSGLRDEFGDIVRIDAFGKAWFFLSHPDDIEAVLVAHASRTCRDIAARSTRRTVGLGLTASDGELWRRQRKLMAEAFTPKRVQQYAETMIDVVENHVAWGEGDVDVYDEMARLLMVLTSRVLFGASIGVAEVDVVRRAVEEINHFFASGVERILNLPSWVPTPNNVRLERALRRIDAILYTIIAERRSSSLDDDLLGVLIAATDESRASMSDRQLRDEAMTLFLAGHETTTMALGHTLYLVAGHPEVERRIVEELDAVFRDRRPNASDFQALTYMQKVFKESMRLIPPLWASGREAAEPFELRGHPIPKGAQLIMSEWVVHRDPRWYADPTVFDPERFDEEQSRGRPRFAYFPFGGGPRTCIGNQFAMVSGTLVLASILSRYRLRRIPGQTLDLQPSITVRPRGGGPTMRVARRWRPSIL